MPETLLNNYSDDSAIKRYMSEKLAPMVFHNIPLNVLNSGMFSLISEYISQATEQMAFTSSFYLNESFITKSVLPDSIYAEAAIFNIGYGFATPSHTNLLLELKLDDIYKNATPVSDNSLIKQFILDKNTKFNLSNGNVYSLDYDILLQFQDIQTSSHTATIPSWNVQYTNLQDKNSIATNKNIYIPYRVTDQWLCLFVGASEYERQTYVVPNNMANSISNEDRVITCKNHICGFDVKYVRSDGSYEYLDSDHILPMHSTCKDLNPYIHYIMDNPQSIRFMFQLQGNNFFKPELNSSYEITVYTCHGKAANFTTYDETDQPKVITTGQRYSNNGNVLKAAFVIGSSLGGTNIGTTESVRRKTIEAYNTANVLSTDHDIDEWLKTFYFENLLYPFFFKRRDDPWGRIWSGYLALKDPDGYVFRTNTLHGHISYDVLYNEKNGNLVGDNEIIIPPGWLWKYEPGKRDTVIPYVVYDNKVETAKTTTVTNEPYMFSNPFGIRIQKEPFAIGYFNPWINQYISTSRINVNASEYNSEGIESIYHATPMYVHIQRTYAENFYKLTTYIDPTIHAWTNGEALVKHFRQTGLAPTFPELIWNYFKQPLNPFASLIPMTLLNKDEHGDLLFDPEKSYICVRNRNQMDADSNLVWNLSDIWIIDESDPDNIKRIDINIGGDIDYIYGLDSIWGDETKYDAVTVTGDTTITMDVRYERGKEVEFVAFNRVDYRDYYDMKLRNDIQVEIAEKLRDIQVTKIVVKTSYAKKTNKTKTQHSESVLYDIGKPTYEKNASVTFTITYTWFHDPEGDPAHRIMGEISETYTIHNSKRVCIPYGDEPEKTKDNMYVFTIQTDDVTPLEPDLIILYADMHPSPESGTVDYYKYPIVNIPDNKPVMYIKQSTLPLQENNMRVVLTAKLNGASTGIVEMIPIKRDSDGSYLFETDMYPLNQLVDVDNLIHIASVENGGGDWIPTSNGTSVSIDAMNPEMTMQILIKTEDQTHPSEIENNPAFTGYIKIDEYALDEFTLVQELKEMRSIVKFGSPASSLPPGMDLMKILGSYYVLMNAWDALQHFYQVAIDQTTNMKSFDDIFYDQLIRSISDIVKNVIQNTLTTAFGEGYVIPTDLQTILSILDILSNVDDDCQAMKESEVFKGYMNSKDQRMYQDQAFTTELPAIEERCYRDLSTDYEYIYRSGKFEPCTFVVWDTVATTLATYIPTIESIFAPYNIHAGMTVQQVPFVEHTLMNSEKFPTFVSSFLEVHKALEPVIFKRLEGNHYLDCKLLATYGLPHSYTSDLYVDQSGDVTSQIYWPDLNIQMEFDVKLFNNAISINTINELKLIIKSYFNRLTSIHTASDVYSENNNIYVSHIIQQMEEHSNVAYLKFKGWYTDQRNKQNGHYMDATHQAIVQRYQRLEDMPKTMLESYVPEMFTLDDNNIVINILK